MSLPPVEATDAEVTAYVRACVESLDESPRMKDWRFRALGMTYGAAVAMAPERTRMSVRLPVREQRILLRAAKARGLSPEAFLRRVIGTWLVAMEDVDPDLIPFLVKEGPLR